ncbi:hypothetical protein [Vineibacter terrae]|uniref:hypothetical protein n=1 Tax=Vineibacter terrae TaxID=2586908 RepID=UPI002E3289C0|nr:hypothetical protein [Vineibacter terrae]HEX2887888.1 hypothetical protein [Vineibacter terrae]
MTDEDRRDMPSDNFHRSQEAGGTSSSSLGEKAKSLAERHMTAGVGAVDSVGRVVRKVAEDLETELPAVAPYVAEAASGIESASTVIRDRSIGEIVEVVSDFGRKQPATFMAGAVALGLLLSRFVKSGASASPDVRHDGSDAHG